MMSSEKTLNVTFFDYNHNMMTLMFGIEEYNRTKQLQAVILHHRYWHDHQGQRIKKPITAPDSVRKQLKQLLSAKDINATGSGSESKSPRTSSMKE